MLSSADSTADRIIHTDFVVVSREISQ